MRRSMRRVLWERGSQQSNRTDGDSGNHRDTDDATEADAGDDVRGEMPTDPVLGAYDLPDERLYRIDTPMSPEHTPLARYPKSTASADLNDICEHIHLQVFLPSHARTKLRANGGDDGASEPSSGGSDNKSRSADGRSW
jgi:hypothetical protein